MNEEEFQKKFEDWKEKYRRTSLQIARIPEKYKTRFMEIAREEFSDDYGMTLREMVRTWDGVYLRPNEELNMKIDLLADEVNKLKAVKPQKPKEKYIHAADGSKIKIKEQEVEQDG